MSPKRLLWNASILFFALLFAGACSCEEPQLGQQPKIRVQPATIVFTEIGVGNQEERSVTITNEGSAPLRITNVRLDPDGDKSYSLQTPPQLPQELTGTQQLKLTVRFAPQAAGNPESAIWIDSNDPAQARTIVKIRTVGNAPRIEAKPKTLDFGFVETSKSSSREATITNIGTADLEISAITLSQNAKDFTLAAETPKSKTLKPQESFKVKISYSPSDPGGDLGELQLKSNDPATPLARVFLQGRRSEPDIAVSPQLLDFGGVSPGKTRNLPLILANRGGATLTISNIVLGASTSKEYSFFSPGFPIKLEAGQSTSIPVFYAPKDEGIDLGRIEISSDDPDEPKVTVLLQGQSPPSGIQVNPLSLNFGKIPLNASKALGIYISNSGATPLTLKGLPVTSPQGAFTVSNPPALPHTIKANEFITLQVTYSPKANATHNGKLTIESDDPVRPSIEIPLTGGVIPAPPCFLQATPTLVNFGAVDLGKSKALTVEVKNIGSSTCWLFQVGMAPSSSLDFSIVSGTITLPISLGSGSSHKVQAAFTPQVAGPSQGTLQVVHGTGLLNRLPPLQITLTALGAGPRLCVSPRYVDFGGVLPGKQQNANFNLRSCGTKPLTISSIALTSATSKEYSLSQLPSLPLTLDPGKDINLSALYKPTDIGFDAGQVEVKSNGAGNPIDYVYLQGFGKNTGDSCGALTGRICAPDGTTWLTGAIITIKLPNGKTIQTQTDIDGYFYLPCVPPGQHKVDVQKGSFSTDFIASVNADATQSIGPPKCVDPSRTKIAVVWGEYDEVQNILDRLKLTYTFYQENSSRDPARLLRSLSEMKKYDIIFLNCGMDESFLNSTVASNLRAYVQDGGSLYASDFSYDFIEVAWPNAMTWLGNDSTRNAAESGGGAKVNAKVLDPLLVRRLGGRSQVTIQYSFCPCAVAEKAGTGTKTLLSGDRNKSGNPNMPLAFTYKPSPQAGNVVYTTFHNDEQFSRTIDIILRFLIFEL